MSYLTLATTRFEEMVEFYGSTLGFPTVRSWDRETARGRVFDLDGLRLEILDASRECRAMVLPPSGDRLHLVVEVADVEAVHRRLGLPGTKPVETSWGSRMFPVRDPEGVPVWFVQWIENPS